MQRLALRLAIVTLLLAGTVTAQRDYENVDPSGQTVTFWHQHTGIRQEMLREIVQDFNAGNSYGITLIEENQGNYEDIFNKMLVLLGTADVPNLVVAYQNQAATYQIVDGLIDLWPLVRSARWGLDEADRSDFFEGFIQSDVNPTFGGALLGFPPNRSMEVMYYNSDWLEELGFDGPPESPEAFAEAACAALERPFAGATGGGRSLGYEVSLDASRFASWTFAFGGDIFDAETGRYTLDDDGAIAAMTFLQDLQDRGCIDIVTERFGDQTNFGQGRTLFTIGSSSGFPFYREAVEAGATFDWSVDALPHTTAEPVMNIYGASVSMPAGASAEQEVATWIFLQYYTSPEVQNRWARAANYFPVRESVADGMADYFEADPAYERAFSLLRFARSEPPVPGYDFVRSLIAGEMAAILDGADVRATLTAANEEANAILDEQLAGMD
ncbi:MAG: extracellular solute-binding protein [Chloroflexi bacterium]|nr:extracellular solute-binding protein [Trueperaceae bacterium]MBA4169203.1 extracellular solute-binding protein [Chloroflexota bacterium]